jgi:hypothetical protein
MGWLACEAASCQVPACEDLAPNAVPAKACGHTGVTYCAIAHQSLTVCPAHVPHGVSRTRASLCDVQ